MHACLALLICIIYIFKKTILKVMYLELKSETTVNFFLKPLDEKDYNTRHALKSYLSDSTKLLFDIRKFQL